MYCITTFRLLFFFNDTATTEIYTLSLHDALPICVVRPGRGRPVGGRVVDGHRLDARVRQGQVEHQAGRPGVALRSEEHTSELQSQSNLVCRLLLEKKKKNKKE